MLLCFLCLTSHLFHQRCETGKLWLIHSAAHAASYGARDTAVSIQFCLWARIGCFHSSTKSDFIDEQQPAELNVASWNAALLCLLGIQRAGRTCQV
jgi:hypothetical protein